MNPVIFTVTQVGAGLFRRIRVPHRLAGFAICLLALCGGAAAQKPADGNTDWSMYNGSDSADRFSQLVQITPENVGTLREGGRYDLPETTSFQAGPVVIGDTMYVTTPTGTYAINAATGKLLWSQNYPAKSLSLGTPVRGSSFPSNSSEM